MNGLKAQTFNFDRKLKLESHGVKATSDAGLLAYREIDDAFGLMEMTIINMELLKENACVFCPLSPFFVGDSDFWQAHLL